MGSIKIGSMDKQGENPLFPAVNGPFVAYSESIRDLIFKTSLTSCPPLCAGAVLQEQLLCKWLCTSLLSSGLTSCTRNTCRCKPTMPRKSTAIFQFLAAASLKILPLGSLPLPPPSFTTSQTRRLFQQKQSLNTERSIRRNPSGIAGSPYPPLLARVKRE